MKKIKSIVLMTCMVASAFLFSGKNVSAKEFKPDVIGTLSKDGDSVKVKPVNKGTSQYIKYVSSTDELMYVYTDSKNDDPLIGVFDKNGILLGSYDNMVSRDGDYLDLGNTGNTNNAGFFVKIRKGEEYYFEAILNNLSDVGEYNVHLIKTNKKPQVDVYAYNNEEGYITLPNKDIAKLGLSYDKDNYILTMNNTNIPYEIFVNTDYEHLFSDGLLEIKIIGKNTITVDYFSFIISRVSIVFTGNGTLSFKKATNDYIPKSVLSSEGNAYPVVFRVDGPTFDINVDTEQSPIEVEQLIMDSGKIIYSGNSHESVIEARIISINGGEIDALSGNVFSSIFSANAIYINGGITKTSVYSNKDDTFALYETVFLGQEDIIINDGTIVVKYIDPEENVESVYVSPTFSSREEININGGNIYIIMSDKLKEYFDDKLAGIQTNTSDKKTPFISNKANIQSGSTIDISKVKCSLEYSDCVYDGKEKKPAVIVDGLVEGKDYIVAYSNNVNPGTAKVTITGKGDFSGKKEFSFVINMKKGDFSEVGITIKDKNYIYKVTKTGNKFGEVGEVKVIGLKKKSLKKINIATKVTIGGIKYKVTSIGVKAFKGNKKIIKLTIGKNVKTIGAYAFANCKKLKKVTINTKKLKKVGKKAFFRKGGKNISFKVPKSKKKVYKKLLKKAKTKKFVVK